MKLLIPLILATTLVAGAPSDSRAAPPTAPDGLVETKAKGFDHVYVRPGTDLQTYGKVIIQPATVAFRNDWLPNMNNTRRDTASRINEGDMQKIAADHAKWLHATWVEVFSAKAIQVVASAEPKTLLLSPKLVDLYVNAPDKQAPGRQVTLTEDAGKVSLVLEARDATTNALVLQIVDRRTAKGAGRPGRTNSVTNSGDFSEVYRTWAALTVAFLKRGPAPPK